MAIEKIDLHRFKRFKDNTVEIRPTGITFFAGSNNAGKSTVLHCLAVWEFCKTVLRLEKGNAALTDSTTKIQGLGISDDDFYPISLPTLKHLWTNLKYNPIDEGDGYTLWIDAHWKLKDGTPRHLKFGLSLANDRLFVRNLGTNVQLGDYIPTIAYLPPFAGIQPRETRLRGAVRQSRIGAGLSGAVLRNQLLDLFETNRQKRSALKEGRSKITEKDLKELRDSDPWEILQSTLRETFGAELQVNDFNEEYHSHIYIDVIKGTPETPYKLNRFPNFTARDLMVEGAGFLQWLSVYTLAVSPNVDVLLLDEPDAHLHSSLQNELIRELAAICRKKGKQALLATHSTEVLSAQLAENIYEISDRKLGYLKNDVAKKALFLGLGSNYSPKLDRLQRQKRVLFFEGFSDYELLLAFANKLGIDISSWVPWQMPASSKQRRHAFLALQGEIDGLEAVGICDRDLRSHNSITPELRDTGEQDIPHFQNFVWKRRNIECYLIHPAAIAAASGQLSDTVATHLANHYALATGEPSDFKKHNLPSPLLDIDGKELFSDPINGIKKVFGVEQIDVAKAMLAQNVPEDISVFLAALAEE